MKEWSRSHDQDGHHDLGMTLTYFMARSAEVAYPRSQVSHYRTIGPLVKCLKKVKFLIFKDHFHGHDGNSPACYSSITEWFLHRLNNCASYSGLLIKLTFQKHMAFCSHWKMSRIMRKTDFCLCENSFPATAKLISAFVFARQIVQFLFFLNTKFQASSLLL